MKRIILTLIFILTNSILSAQNECVKCDVQRIKVVYENLDNLTYKILEEFLCTFDKSCETNVEYTEWSNEMLFSVIENSTDIYFEVLKGLKDEKKNLLLNEIGSPVNEIDFQKIYNKIKFSNTTEELKKQYLNTMENIAKKSGIKIRN